MNASAASKVAIDIPSGLSADRGSIGEGAAGGEAVRAQWTVTFAHPKAGFPFLPARALVGEVDVVDIGIPAEIRREVGMHARIPEPHELAAWLPRRGPGSHKGEWGKLLVVGGSPGLTGALALASRAALRMGAGLVRIGLPRSLNPILEEKVTEAMTIPLPEGEEGQLLSSGAERILSGFGDWNALVLGPGLGRSPEGDRLVMRLLGGWKGPILVDADGLNALAAWGPDSWVPRAREVRSGGEPGGAVFTPHLGEMSRLTGRPVSALAADPIGAAREWAERWGVTLVLKGAPSVISAPSG
jgi:NAD(P)H-hydrate epimerase